MQNRVLENGNSRTLSIHNVVNMCKAKAKNGEDLFVPQRNTPPDITIARMSDSTPPATSSCDDSSKIINKKLDGLQSSMVDFATKNSKEFTKINKHIKSNRSEMCRRPFQQCSCFVETEQGLFSFEYYYHYYHYYNSQLSLVDFSTMPLDF